MDALLSRLDASVYAGEWERGLCVHSPHTHSHPHTLETTCHTWLPCCCCSLWPYASLHTLHLWASVYICVRGATCRGESERAQKWNERKRSHSVYSALSKCSLSALRCVVCVCMQILFHLMVFARRIFLYVRNIYFFLSSSLQSRSPSPFCFFLIALLFAFFFFVIIFSILLILSMCTQTLPVNMWVWCKYVSTMVRTES